MMITDFIHSYCLVLRAEGNFEEIGKGLTDPGFPAAKDWDLGTYETYMTIRICEDVVLIFNRNGMDVNALNERLGLCYCGFRVVSGTFSPVCEGVEAAWVRSHNS